MRGSLGEGLSSSPINGVCVCVCVYTWKGASVNDSRDPGTHHRMFQGWEEVKDEMELVGMQ